MISPEDTLYTIPKELDANDWQLEYDATDIQVYSKFGASSAGVIGFKTVTVHPVSIDLIFELLKDVCGAMNEINHMFVLGEVFRSWETPSDPNGTLVRTSFKMPFPFADREFLHGLHSTKIDDGVFVVGYTPVDDDADRSIPIQEGYVRCPTRISGQRITQLENGSVRVEHLMVYFLGGRISQEFQDNWLKKSHVGAYVKEWRSLRTQLFPPKLEHIQYDNIKKLCLDALAKSKDWKKVGKPKSGEIRYGRLAYAPRSVYRTDIDLNAPFDQVVNVIADESLTYLPQWNKEFMTGTVIEFLEDTPTKKAWLIRVHYKTPFFLANREYIYYFSREYLNEDEALIIYYSINSQEPVPDGFVRALLYPSVHRCTRLNAQQTRLEHLLVTDLGGKLSKRQDKLLKGGLVQAHERDMKNQVALFGRLG